MWVLSVFFLLPGSRRNAITTPAAMAVKFPLRCRHSQNGCEK